MAGVIFVYADTVFGFYGYSFLCLVGCFSMIIWTPAVLSVIHACFVHLYLHLFSAMERRSRNTLVTIIIIIIIIIIIHFRISFFPLMSPFICLRLRGFFLNYSFICLFLFIHSFCWRTFNTGNQSHAIVSESGYCRKEKVASKE